MAISYSTSSNLEESTKISYFSIKRVPDFFFSNAVFKVIASYSEELYALSRRKKYTKQFKELIRSDTSNNIFQSGTTHNLSFLINR